MSKIVYCSECGTTIQIMRKAMPRFGRIIDLIEPHICLEIPIKIDLKVNPVPMFVQEPKGKFVQILNDLQPGPGVWPEPGGFPEAGQSVPPGTIGTDDLRDRRDTGSIKSTAPRSILSGVKSLDNTTPTHDLSDPEIDNRASDEGDE